jgi:hypothetical protein
MLKAKITVIGEAAVNKKSCWYAFPQKDGRDQIMHLSKAIIERKKKRFLWKRFIMFYMRQQDRKINQMKVFYNIFQIINELT